MSVLQKLGLSLGITIALSSYSANALPVASALSDRLNPQKLIQLISQNGIEPPEVIIEPDPDTNPSPNPNPNPTPNSDTRFTCEYNNGEYTVMYNPESQPNRSYPWAIPSQMGGGWTAERRCNEITSRLEAYRADGLLELTTSVENNYDIICVTTQVDPTDCRIVLTVPPGQDPVITRDLVFENLTTADSGQQTQGVYTFTSKGEGGELLDRLGNVIQGSSSNNSSGIDLRPYLDSNDGGTGEMLSQGNNTPTKSRQLNPELFN